MLMCITSLKALFTPPRHSESFVHCVDVTHLLVFEGCSQDTSATIKDSKSSFRRRVIQQSASNIFQMFCTPECQEWFIFREDRASLRLSQIHTVSIQNEICSQIVSFECRLNRNPRRDPEDFVTRSDMFVSVAVRRAS